MELIRPSEVSGKILSLIEDAKDYLIIVSPYNDFNDWPKFVTRFNEAQKRNIKIAYYARANEKHKGIELIAVKPILIKNLHAKLYLNEKYAIFSSMNLVKYSDDYSIDFAFKTQNDEEYKQAKEFYELYIKEKAEDQTKLSYSLPFQNELPLSGFYKKNDQYFKKNIALHKVYFSGTHFLKEIGHFSGKKKLGVWHYFSGNGLVKKVEQHWDEYSVENVTYEGKVSKYDLIFGIGNMIGGFYNCSISDFYFKSKLSDFTKGDNLKLINHLKDQLGISYIDYDVELAEDLVDEIHEQLRNKVF